MSRKCPFTNCNKTISSSYFACAPHWFQVPKVLQAEIYAAYSRYKKAEGAQEGLQAARELEEAQKKAIEAVEGRQ